MSYTPPAEVISPRKAITSVRVLIDEGEGGFAVAALQWDGEERIGLRWNGSVDNPIGNPQSRGIPTWFVLPVPIAELITRDLAQDLQNTGGITRVRVRPLPKRIDSGQRLAPRDDLWILASAGEDTLEINNLATGHRLVLNRQHVKRLVPDTVADTSTGPKHGLLELNVQITFEDGEARLEVGQVLRDRVAALATQLRESGYAEQHDAVKALIDEARVDLCHPDSALGPWESECLDYAATAVEANFLKLALASIDKAILVNTLPPEDYDYGFSYTTRQRSRAANS